MNILIEPTVEKLWKSTVRWAEERVDITLSRHIERYLISLLIDYTNKPEISKKTLCTTFLKAQQNHQLRASLLKEVGDECLLYAGFFSDHANKKHVTLDYFIELGRASYHSLSNHHCDLFADLALHFVMLMDILQTIKIDHQLMPMEAYERWNQWGSRRALQILQNYTLATPLKTDH